MALVPGRTARYEIWPIGGSMCSCVYGAWGNLQRSGGMGLTRRMDGEVLKR